LFVWLLFYTNRCCIQEQQEQNKEIPEDATFASEEVFDCFEKTDVDGVNEAAKFIVYTLPVSEFLTLKVASKVSDPTERKRFVGKLRQAASKQVKSRTRVTIASFPAGFQSTAKECNDVMIWADARRVETDRRSRASVTRFSFPESHRPPSSKKRLSAASSKPLKKRACAPSDDDAGESPAHTSDDGHADLAGTLLQEGLNFTGVEAQPVALPPVSKSQLDRFATMPFLFLQCRSFVSHQEEVELFKQWFVSAESRMKLKNMIEQIFVRAEQITEQVIYQAIDNNYGERYSLLSPIICELLGWRDNQNGVLLDERINSQRFFLSRTDFDFDLVAWRTHVSAILSDGDQEVVDESTSREFCY
jgi:hypothetical protein